MKVKEVMVREVVTLSPHDSIKKAMDILFKMQISGLPVVDGEGKLVGMFTEKSILSRAYPAYIEKIGGFVYADDPKSVKSKFAELESLRVEQLMRREVFTTTEDSSLSEAAHVMLVERARRLPVVDLKYKVVGIIARCDIVKALFKQAGLL